MKTLIELEPGDCRYITDDETFLFCAKPKHVYLLDGKTCQSSYCSVHHLICIQPLKENVRAA